ncbi:N-acetylmuramic acid 6-phosphate etherase (plasmid) [Deinococcus radiomollis]|uniref:N-acetylmuramic acid 6-phosphate etherase n=1 Tax=Deinococcus radiomollis TaxID=468916 RepID=UPI003891B1E8
MTGGPDTTLLATEQIHPQHLQLDAYDTDTLVKAFSEDQRTAVEAVLQAGKQIAAAVGASVERLQAGGRLVYMGAGTSGRLGVLDGVELIPTFSWPEERLVTLIAGGMGAVYRAVEGAEDDEDRAADDLVQVGLNAKDAVIVIASSGTTP